MGLHVEPRAVSILVNNRDTGIVSLTGRAAAEAYGTDEALAHSAVHISAGDFDRAGHMIATSSELSMFFDPTFQQFSPSGSPAEPFMGPIELPVVQDGMARVDFGERVQVGYFFDDTNSGWQEDFERAKPQWEEPARWIVANIEAGGRPKDLDFEINWEALGR